MEQHQTLPAKKIESVLRKQTNWNNLWFYQKTVVLYRMTYVFTRRFLPAFGDRTVDQMVQAARSGKQNIVEGSADGVTSMDPTSRRPLATSGHRKYPAQLSTAILRLDSASSAGLLRAGYHRTHPSPAPLYQP